MTADALTAADEEAAAEALARDRRTDGLPIVVPTPARVERMLQFSPGLPPDAVLGQVWPAGGKLTVEKAAINAVMAGCPAEIFPLVVAVCEALVDDEFDAGPLQTTTHCVTPLIIVNGPARERFGVSHGAGALGPGHRVNLTLGRALRLIMINVGGGVVGIGDMATLGSPAKLACCLAEAEEDAPFEPLHVSRGFAPEDSTVTLLAVEGFHSLLFNLTDVGEQADYFLRTLGAGFANPASNNIYTGLGVVAAVLNPIHAAILKRAGLTRRVVQEKLFQYAATTRTALRAIAGSNIDVIGHQDEIVRVVQKPEDFLIFTSGDNGGAYSGYFPTWGGGRFGSRAVTKRVRSDVFCEVPGSQRA